MKTYPLLSALSVTALILIGCAKHEQANPSGSLEATETDIVSTIPARIALVRADLGDKVHAGDTLIVLDTELLALQKAQAEANRQALHAQRAALGAQEQQAIAQQGLAEITLTRMQKLFDQGSATQQQLDETHTKRYVAGEQVRALQSQAQALIAEEGKLNASLAVFDRQLKEGALFAPVSGTIILRSAEPGEMASPGGVLLRLADLSKLDLRVFLSERDLGKVKLGDKLSVLVDALPNETLTGTVTWISSEAEFTPKNAQTREARTQLVYAVKLLVENPDDRLHIGMPAEVKLPS